MAQSESVATIRPTGHGSKPTKRQTPQAWIKSASMVRATCKRLVGEFEVALTAYDAARVLAYSKLLAVCDYVQQQADQWPSTERFSHARLAERLGYSRQWVGQKLDTLAYVRRLFDDPATVQPEAEQFASIVSRFNGNQAKGKGGSGKEKPVEERLAPIVRKWLASGHNVDELVALITTIAQSATATTRGGTLQVSIPSKGKRRKVG